MADFERSGGRIIRVKYNAAEKKAMNEAIGEQLRAEAAKHEKEDLAVFAWELHVQLDWDEEQIARFLTNFYPTLQNFIKHYEVDITDASWLCSNKLKDAGINFDDIYEHIKS